MAERHAPDIRIFVSCHKAFPVPEGGLLYPIHVGAALADRPLDGYIRDDSGENISRLNRRYCELTGQYWAWKNEDAEYYGFSITGGISTPTRTAAGRISSGPSPTGHFWRSWATVRLPG